MIFYYLLACYGLMFIIKYGTPLKFLRNFLSKRFSWGAELIKCQYCVGFWAGVFVGIVIALASQPILIAILLPLASSAFCGIVEDILNEYLGIKG